MKTANVKTAHEIYAENLTWEQSESLRQGRRETLYKWGAISGWGLAILCTLSVAPLLHLQHVVAAMVLVDKTTGDYRVERNGESLTVGGNDDANHQRFISDLGAYVKAREGFSRAEADNNYKTVWLMDTNDLRGPWDNYYKPDLNKNSPVVLLKPSDSVTLANFSFTFLPTGEAGEHLAQVRYDLVKKIGQLPITSQRMVSTVTFRYDPQNIPSDMDGLVLNAYGFETINYHRDEDGPVRQISVTGAQPSATDYSPPNTPSSQYTVYPQALATTPQIERGNVSPSVASTVKAGIHNLISGKGNGQ